MTNACYFDDRQRVSAQGIRTESVAARRHGRQKKGGMTVVTPPIIS